MGFTEDWYPDAQMAELRRQYESVRQLTGRVVEIGCWEGKSTVILANTCYPEILIAVDWWRGNVAEAIDHISVATARERDVFSVFKKNIEDMTRGNVDIRMVDCFDFLRDFRQPVKFCHIDASHDYASVRRTIEMLLPIVVPGGVLCGDDYLNAHAGRDDLGGGVERACSDVLPDHGSVGNLWVWRNVRRGFGRPRTQRFHGAANRAVGWLRRLRWPG